MDSVKKSDDIFFYVLVGLMVLGFAGVIVYLIYSYIS